MSVLEAATSALRDTGATSDTRAEATRARLVRSLERRTHRRRQMVAVVSVLAVMVGATASWAWSTGRLENLFGRGAVPREAPPIDRAPPRGSDSARTAAAPIGVDRAAPATAGVAAVAPVSVGVERNAPATIGVDSAAPASIGVERTAPATVGVDSAAPATTNVERTAPATIGVDSASPATTDVERAAPAPQAWPAPTENAPSRAPVAKRPRATKPAEVLYRRAHELHFHGDDRLAALAAWDAYLAAESTGTFAIEARFNRGLLLARLARYPEAILVLEPFARGEVADGYRRDEAAALVTRLRALTEAP